MSYSYRMQHSHIYSTFFAPRGRARMYDLGMQIAQMYLSPFDQIIGVIGEAGSGKSVLIKGMFPGLEMTNDDNGVNVRPLPLLEPEGSGFFTPHTFHVDIRFEQAFTQMHVLADAIMHAVKLGRRVIVEHFDLIYPYLKTNAHLLISIGEEIIVTRPNLFGPDPAELSKIAVNSIRFRLMAHTAEDLCELTLQPDDLMRCEHDDIHHGFVLAFQHTPPQVNLEEMEAQVKDMIRQDLPVSYADEGHIYIGTSLHPCTGPRTHVASTSLVENFRLLHRLIYDSFKDRYLLVGSVGDSADRCIEYLAEVY